MPLKKGSSREVISANIKELIEAGHDPDQAEAIAYKEARKTTDFDGAGHSRYYTVSKLGPKRSLTPEGYLLCLDVPVARTGEMVYAEGEIAGEDGEAILGGPDKLIRVSRGPEELFRPETIASFEGKPITLGHPEEFVTPDNIKQYSVGTMFNVRRGTGMQDDLMLADFLITDRKAIDAVQKGGIEEVSNGYEADYEQQQPGRAAQRNIIGNHNALVPNGRCGPRCAIGDEDMPVLKKKSWKDRMMAAFKTGDEKEVEKIASEVKDEEESEEDRVKREKEGKTADGLQKVLDKLAAMDADIQELKKKVEDEEEEEGPDGTMDTVIGAETAGKLSDAGVKLYTGDSAKHIPALAEILAPGTKLPTFDGKTTDAQRALQLCKCQRKALDAAYQTDAGKSAIDPFLGGQKADFGRMPLPALNAAFVGAANLMRAKNNDGNHRASLTTRDFGRTTTVSDINAKNREFYAKR
ncbi:hypothetical protein FHW84_001822 [Dyella sp. SG562]|uniref:DUF2213 domain-containing protein n=1 Tax=Dyella sp. SG562 TaxID=2587017 RepID=UPI0014214D00|nr:DUF2213 domain-containing protein [Dyella sp. SG562]NII73253.1 hypothetical protein [Dyella sp. SG562]